MSAWCGQTRISSNGLKLVGPPDLRVGSEFIGEPQVLGRDEQEPRSGGICRQRKQVQWKMIQGKGPMTGGVLCSS